MKNLFRANLVIAVCLLATACGQALQVTSSPVSPTTTATTIPLTATPVPSQTATATIEVTTKPTYARPTLIPTIDPALLPDLLNKALAIQALDMNGYKTRHITGWDFGFGTTVAPYVHCPSHVWLDASHILLYPKAGQTTNPIEGAMRAVEVVPQPVVMNLETGSIWLPPVDISSGQICNHVFWSRELKILITTENNSDTSTVSTFTYDGEKLSSYPGKLLDISPKGTKILLTDYKVIDFKTNKKIELNWNLVPYEYYWDFYWTSDETRIYRCCYFYADLVSEKNFQFAESDFLDSQGNLFEYSGLSMYRGRWIQDDSRFLVEWSWGEDGDIRYLPMFDPATRTIFDVRGLAGISNDWTCYQTSVSPDGKYVWMAGADGSYLIDLFTFEAQFYPGQDYFYTDWSPDSNFIWAYSHKYNILSIADKGVRSPLISPLPESEHLWHPMGNIVVYPAEDKNALIFLDATTMSVRELPFKNQDPRYKISNLVWNPNGDKLTFITESHILWQVDYPALENLEQIIASTNTISGAQWSPDGNSIAFISSSDIYIVDTVK